MLVAMHLHMHVAMPCLVAASPACYHAELLVFGVGGWLGSSKLSQPGALSLRHVLQIVGPIDHATYPRLPIVAQHILEVSWT